jgi:hypothetical protein
MTTRSRALRLWLVALLAAVATAAGLAPAAAEERSGPRTYQGPTYSSTYPLPPTQGENQGKLWFHADAWWALMVEPTGRTLRVFELMPDHTWRPTSAVVNNDVGDVGDALLDGDTVHVLTRRSDASLYYVRLSFDAAARDYRVAPASLVVSRKSTTPATIAKDAAGAIWVGYANATNVVVTHSEDGGLTWGRVVTLATVASGTPEAGALVAFDDRVGMLWSDQATGAFQFASHRAGDDPTVWTREVAASGPTVADNHVGLTRVPGSTGDTLLAVVKTSDAGPTGDNAAGAIDMLVRKPGGGWATAPVSEVADGLNDPTLQVDLVTRRVHVFATHDLSIVEKTAPLDAIRFSPGIGEIFVNGTGHQMSDPTTAKEPADARSGMVVLASDSHAFTYRHAEVALAPPTPVADPADHQPPTSPTAVRAQTISPQSVVLAWNPANDGTRWFPGEQGVPVAGYIVLRNGKELATVTSTALEDEPRTAAQAAGATSVEYSVTAVDASGNRSAPVTLVVELPGSQQPRALVIGAIVLLGLAASIIAWNLLHRRAVARAERSPRTEEPVLEEPRDPTPVS